MGWLSAAPLERDVHFEESDEYLTVSTSHSITRGEVEEITKQLWHGSTPDAQNNVVYVSINLRSGEIRGFVPLTTPEQLYYSDRSRGRVVGNDMRLMLRWGGVELDRRAVYALFQYGTIPPTMTLSRAVRRIPPGRRFILGPNADAPSLDPYVPRLERPPAGPDAHDPAVQVTHAMGAILEPLPQSSVLYFSGGVDSALLASRLVEIGRTDVTLLNYSFGPHDVEARLALEMASQLGLACEQIQYDPSEVGGMVERIAEDYSYPFGDFSAIPTNLLVYASLPWAGRSRTVIDGTGADGAFGKVVANPRAWHGLYSVPVSIRRTLGGGYRLFKLWKPSDRLIRVAPRVGLIRFSARMPLSHAAVISQNALEGIAYVIPPELHCEIEEDIRTGIQDLGAGLEEEGQFSLLDLVQVCSGMFAAKIYDPLRRNGIEALFPYLEASALKMSFGLRWDEKWEGGESKGLLKRMLAGQVRREMVYRRKSGFVPPIRETLALPLVQDLLRDVVLSQGNPLIDLIETRTTREMVEHASQGRVLGIGAHNFLWVLLFTTVWLQGLDRGKASATASEDRAASPVSGKG